MTHKARTAGLIACEQRTKGTEAIKPGRDFRRSYEKLQRKLPAKPAPQQQHLTPAAGNRHARRPWTAPIATAAGRARGRRRRS